MYSRVEFLVLRELLHCWWLLSWWSFRQNRKQKEGYLRTSFGFKDRIGIVLPLMEGPGLSPVVGADADVVGLLPWMLAPKEDG